MEKHTINTNSWHYQFINRFREIGTYSRPNDICQYRQWFISAIFRMLLIYGAITIFAVFPLMHLMLWLVAGFVVGKFSMMPGPLAGWCIAVVVIALVIAAVYGLNKLVTWWTGRPSHVATPKAPGTMTLMYRALKQKYCVKVEFE